MANNVITGPMQLPVPIVGQELGPQYATDINSCMSLISQHNHSAGQGNQIGVDGLSIQSNLPLNGNSLSSTLSVLFNSQVSNLSTPGTLYVTGNELWYNDFNSAQVKLTNMGSVAGSSGTIGGLVSPASVTYSALTGTYTFQSANNTAADLNIASLIVQSTTPNTLYSITLQPPTLSSNYTLTLPASPPSSTLPLVMTTGGNVSTSLIATTMFAVGSINGNIIAGNTLPNSAIVPNTITGGAGGSIGLQTIDQNNMQVRSYGNSTVGSIAISSDITFNINTGGSANSGVFNLTTQGNPCIIGLRPNGGNFGQISLAVTSTGVTGVCEASATVTFILDGVSILEVPFAIGSNGNGLEFVNNAVWPTGQSFIHPVSSGAHTLSMTFSTTASGGLTTNAIFQGQYYMYEMK